VNGKAIFGEGRELKIGRRRCATYDKKDLLTMSRKLGMTTVNDSMSKTAICEELEKFANRKREEKQNNMIKVRRERVNSVRVRIENENRRKREREEQLEREKRNDAINRIGMTKNIIRKEIPEMYGKAFMKKYGKLIEPYMESQVNLMLNTLQKHKFNLGVRGYPLKSDVNEFKQDLVQRWKSALEPELYKLTVFSNNDAARANLRKLIGPNKEITNEILNSYKKSIIKAAVERNNSGKFANKNKLQKAKQSWLYVQRTYGLLKSPSPPRRQMTINEKRKRGIDVEEI